MFDTHRPMPLLMKPADVAFMTGISVNTLQNQRVKRIGLPFVKFGGAVRYKAADVLAFCTASPLLGESRV